MRSIKRIEDLNKNYMNKKLGCLNVGILSLATMQSRNSHWEGEQKVCNATLTPRGVILALLTNGVRDIRSVSSQVCFSSMVGLCTLSFCFPTKMPHLNAPMFSPLKCSVIPKKVTKMLNNAHHREAFLNNSKHFKGV